MPPASTSSGARATPPTASTRSARSASRCARSSGTRRSSAASPGPAPRCGHHIHPTAGTIFHKSSTSLQLWFYAIYLVSSSRCGIAAKQLERELGVNYKTALRMLHLIREYLMEQDYAGPLSGEVEADETSSAGRSARATGRKLRAAGTVEPWPGD